MAINSVFILMLLLTCFCGFSAAAEQGPHSAGVTKIDFDDIRLTITERPGEMVDGGGYILKFSRQEREIYEDECAFRIRAPQILAGAPAPDCRSLLSYCFTGGAHCCMSLIIATSCHSQHALNVIDLAHSDGPVKVVDIGTGGAKALKVTDWQFAYYTPEKIDMGLSFAASPGMTRLLVFDGGKWRVDGAGEFSRFYEKLYRQAQHTAGLALKKQDLERSAGAAIKAAYYLMMSGKPADEATAELARLLPPSWKSGAGTIGEDIRQAISTFNPVEVIE